MNQSDLQWQLLVKKSSRTISRKAWDKGRSQAWTADPPRTCPPRRSRPSRRPRGSRGWARSRWPSGCPPAARCRCRRWSPCSGRSRTWRGRRQVCTTWKEAVKIMFKATSPTFCSSLSGWGTGRGEQWRQSQQWRTGCQIQETRASWRREWTREERSASWKPPLDRR